MNIERLHKLAGKEEIDYQLLLGLLKDYARPRDKITAWLKSGVLVRVKKGLYIFGREIATHYFSEEVLANLIYGPSAISLSSALAFYGLIPERPQVITSITNKRNKIFVTLVGTFTYTFLNNTKFNLGIEWFEHGNNINFLIASPEKALCDHVHLIDKKIVLNSFEEVEAYLLYDLRLDEHRLKKLKVNDLSQLSRRYEDKRIYQISQFIKKWK